MYFRKKSLHTCQKKDLSPHENNKSSCRNGSVYFYISMGKPKLLQAVDPGISLISFRAADHVRPISHQPPDLHLQYRSDASSP